MTDSKAQTITFEKLDDLFSTLIEYAQTLEVLGVIAELISSTTMSEELSDTLLQKMQNKLDERNSVKDYFAYADYPHNLNCENYEVNFLIRGLELSVKNGEYIDDYPEEISRLLKLISPSQRLSELIKSNVETLMITIPKGRDDIIQLFTGERRVERIWSLIRLIQNYWDDPLYCISSYLKLIDIAGSEDEASYGISLDTLQLLYSSLKTEDRQLISDILHMVDNKHVNVRLESEFRECCEMYRQQIELWK